MLKVLPVQSKPDQEKLCSECNVTYKPDLLAYAAYVDGNFAGICQFRTTDRGGELFDIAPSLSINSFEALFVMGRGALNFIDLCGIHNAFYVGDISGEEQERLLTAIGFKKDERGEYAINLEGFFTDHCH